MGADVGPSYIEGIFNIGAAAFYAISVLRVQVCISGDRDAEAAFPNFKFQID